MQSGWWQVLRGLHIARDTKSGYSDVGAGGFLHSLLLQHIADGTGKSAGSGKHCKGRYEQFSHVGIPVFIWHAPAGAVGCI